ncbi:MAG: hypothetical protein ACRC1K_11490, partial [Planctomycetia bacterium]
MKPLVCYGPWCFLLATLGVAAAQATKPSAPAPAPAPAAAAPAEAAKAEAKPAVAEKADPKAEKPAEKKPADAKADEAKAAEAKAVQEKAAKEAAEAQKNQQRQQKLQQTTFDRRASTYLKTWSTPKNDETKKGDAKKDDAKKGAATKKAKPDEPPDPFDAELVELQKAVTLGDWPAVKATLAKWPEDVAKTAYKKMLQSMTTVQRNQQQQMSMNDGEMALSMDMEMAMMQSNPNMAQFAEKNVLSIDDFIGLAAAAPKGLEKDNIGALGGLLNAVVSTTVIAEDAVKRLHAECAKPDGKGAFTKRQAAKMLLRAGLPERMAGFLPDVEQARKDADLEALNLLAQQFLSQYYSENKLDQLENAWAVTQAILEAKDGERTEQEAALVRSVELAPKVREQLGKAWLDQSFTSRPQRGMDILATIGRLTAGGLTAKPYDPTGRLKALELQ